jgi:hypothetical protein
MVNIKGTLRYPYCSGSEGGPGCRGTKNFQSKKLDESEIHGWASTGLPFDGIALPGLLFSFGRQPAAESICRWIRFESSLTQAFESPALSQAKLLAALLLLFLSQPLILV